MERVRTERSWICPRCAACRIADRIALLFFIMITLHSLPGALKNMYSHFTTRRIVWVDEREG